MRKGIDVSQWQGTINWAKVKADDVDFAILKVVNKSNAVEPSFETNYAQAKAQSIPLGVYNYSYATTVAKAEKDAHAVVKALNGRHLACKVWLDVEDSCQKGLGITLINLINAYKVII